MWKMGAIRKTLRAVVMIKRGDVYKGVESIGVHTMFGT